jgi:hypothetical protein
MSRRKKNKKKVQKDVRKKQGWDITIEGDRAVVVVPDEDVLEPATGNMLFPMRHLTAQLQAAIAKQHGSRAEAWKYSDGWRGVMLGAGKKGYSTFILYKDKN